jgi:hypothetical protein
MLSEPGVGKPEGPSRLAGSNLLPLCPDLFGEHLGGTSAPAGCRELRPSRKTEAECIELAHDLPQCCRSRLLRICSTTRSSSRWPFRQSRIARAMWGNLPRYHDFRPQRSRAVEFYANQILNTPVTAHPVDRFGAMARGPARADRIRSMRPRCRAAHASCGRHVALRDRVGRAQSRQPTGLPSHRYLLNRRVCRRKMPNDGARAQPCRRLRPRAGSAARASSLPLSGAWTAEPRRLPPHSLKPVGSTCTADMAYKRSPRPRCFPSALAWLLPRRSRAGKQASDSNHLLLVASRAVNLGLVRGEARYPPGAQDHDLGRAGASSALPAISASPKPPSKSVAAI